MIGVDRDAFYRYRFTSQYEHGFIPLNKSRVFLP